VELKYDTNWYYSSRVEQFITIYTGFAYPRTTARILFGIRMSTQQQLLEQLAEYLRQAGIEYMITGSIGSSFHGKPRATNDIDIIINPSSQQLDVFLKIIETKFYVNPQTAREAFKNSSAFNIIDGSSGYKADLVILKKRAFSRTEFARKKQVRLMDGNFSVISAEDAILSKLEWSKGRQSDLQFNDALAVALVQWKTLDFEYLNEWAAQLGIKEDLTTLLDKARWIICQQ
jgi:hypothetical protein